MAFQKVGFIGLGLIGGSIAKKLKQNQPDIQIYATARHAETIAEAYREGIIENSELLPLDAFFDCDYLFLCAPVHLNLDYLRQLQGHIKSGCCITDVGSTKTEIHEEVKRLGLEASFIGGHPMTGSEKTGILSADATLLENAYYIITPTAQTPRERISEFRDFVLSLGALPLILDYETHDRATAAISHLPHMVAFTLVNLVRQLDDEQETMKTIAAGGFKDITRIASSSPVMWQNICFSNQKQLLSLMDRYVELLQKLRAFISEKDEEALLAFFGQAKDYRDSITLPSVKSAAAAYECFVDIRNETGKIAAVAGLLAQYHINIKNIGIVNNREFAAGVLQLVFFDRQTLTRAVRILKDSGYVIHCR